MIILTAAQAAKVRGRSPSTTWAALDPVPLVDGTFMLPESVLTDPAHADAKALLAALPIATVPASNMFVTGKDATAKQISDYTTAIASVPKWQSVGVAEV